MELKIIKTKKDYHTALERFEEIFSSKSGTKESNEADILSLLIQDYENKNFVIKADKKLTAQQEQILQFLYSEIIERRPYSSSKMCEVVIEFIEQLNTKK